MTSPARARPFRAARPVLTLALLSALLVGCGLHGPAYNDKASPQVDEVVEMTNLMNYSPAAITIAQGDTVEWRNTSLVGHTVTAIPGAAKNPAHVVLPPGAEPFDSGNIPAGQLYRHRFNVPGTYIYFCRPHEGMGMVGTVVVKPAG